jgi:hypothetical protein
VADKKLNELDQTRAPALEALLYLVQEGVDHRIERQHLLTLPGYVDGLGLEYVDDHTVTVSAGRATAAAEDFLIGLEAPIAVDLTASGADGLDAGAEAPDTWYAVHVIGDTSGSNPTSGLLSTSADSPTLPGGYDRSRRVGWVRNDAAGDLMPFSQARHGSSRWYWWDAESGDTRVLDGGSATSWSAVSLAGFAPPGSTEVAFQIWFQWGTGQAQNKLRLRPGGSTVQQSLWQYRSGCASGINAVFESNLPCGDAREIDYMVDDPGNRVSLDVRGFADSLEV